ncbi:UNVERIFIED_CONTAM: hypothetical protein Slati_1954600 [Sesamum latifolium]|uniref:PGG domain-containing protein n=1 Tax=Sesamum latifolium TaxID=2727402 RepID=A0AAW2WMK0_9LAMI
MPRKNRVQKSRWNTQIGDKKKREGNSKGKSEDDGIGIGSSLHSVASQFADESESLPVVYPIAAEDSTPPQHNQNQTPQPKGDGSGQRSLCYTLMYQAAMKGDWQAAAVLLQRNPNLASAKITESGDTALHMAAATSRTRFVRELVGWMAEGDLLSKNKHGHTAFCYAAASGIVEIAAVMREKNENLITCPGNNEMKPLYIAASLGNKDMVSYLYKFTHVKDLSITEWFDLLIVTIRNNMHDTALDILNNSDGTLATMRTTTVIPGENDSPDATKNKGTALHELAVQDISDISASQEAITDSFNTMFAAVPLLSRFKWIFEQPLMRKRARLVAERLWAQMQRLDRANVLKLLEEPPILHEAAKIGSMKELIAISVDDNHNNIMHLAGKLAPPERLKIVSGAALQMQRELLWFKEVEKVVPPPCLEIRNRRGLRPRQLFSKEHEPLLTKGETWMKETANNCMIVATLIATVAFAAAFTLPGGNNGDTGMQYLRRGRGSQFLQYLMQLHYFAQQLLS